MEFAWPNDSRTPSKRDEIAAPPHSPKAARRSAAEEPAFAAISRHPAG